MKNIEELAISTYNANMEFFKKKHEFLYNKLSAFLFVVVLNQAYWNVLLPAALLYILSTPP